MGEARELRVVEYECRDLGYGVEFGLVAGFWGPRDWTGKRELVPLFDDEDRIYLFDDEVLSDCEV